MGICQLIVLPLSFIKLCLILPLMPLMQYHTYGAILFTLIILCIYQIVSVVTCTLLYVTVVHEEILSYNTVSSYTDSDYIFITFITIHWTATN